MEKGRRGITFVALIITIIVMLILAGLVINLTMRRKWYNKKHRASNRKAKRNRSFRTIKVKSSRSADEKI